MVENSLRQRLKKGLKNLTDNIKTTFILTLR